MPPKKPTRVVEVDPDEFDQTPGSAGEDSLAGVLAELGESGGGTVRVDRLREGRRPEYIDEFDVSGFNLKLLRDQHGGGEYRITVKDSGKKYRGSSTVAIASPRQAIGSQSAPAGEPAATDKLLVAMQKQSELLALLVARAAAPAQDNTAARRALLEDLALMKQITGGGQTLGPEKIVELFTLGMNLKSQVEDRGEGGVNWTPVLEKLADALGEPLARILENVVPGAPAASPPAARAAASATLPRPGGAQKFPGAVGDVLGLASATLPRPGGAQSQDKNAMKLQGYISFLVKQAENEADPQLYAAFILDNVPDATLRPFVAGGVDALVERLAGLDPRVHQHLDWFKQLGQAVVEELGDNAPGVAISAADAGGAGNPT